jgi:hypothetical protein
VSAAPSGCDARTRAQSPRTSSSAESISRNSLALRRPTDEVRRSTATAVVCSTSTRLRCPRSSIVGRKERDGAEREVGQTSTVLRASNSSACTTTAKRSPCCSRPRAARAARSRNTSPRTMAVNPRAKELPTRPSQPVSAASPERRTGRPRPPPLPRVAHSCVDADGPLRAARAARPPNHYSPHSAGAAGRPPSCHLVERVRRVPYAERSTFCNTNWSSAAGALRRRRSVRLASDGRADG